MFCCYVSTCESAVLAWPSGGFLYSYTQHNGAPVALRSLAGREPAATPGKLECEAWPRGPAAGTGAASKAGGTAVSQGES